MSNVTAHRYKYVILYIELEWEYNFLWLRLKSEIPFDSHV